jgi:hypothetical protein
MSSARPSCAPSRHLFLPLLGAGLLLVGACERDPRPDSAPADVPAAEGVPAGAGLYPVEIAPGVALVVEREGSRQFRFFGTLDRARALELTVEDGHNVLFGPASVPVQDGAFRIDFVMEPTDRDHVFFYLADADGERLAVVPVDTAQPRTVAGAASAIPATAPEIGVTRMGGDRRTGVTAEGLESPRVRVRWPAVDIGAPAVQLEGETDLPMLRVEVRRREQVLVSQQPRVPGPAGHWNAFATELRVPGGFREEDAIVIAPADAPDAVELHFQPIRN